MPPIDEPHIPVPTSAPGIQQTAEVPMQAFFDCIAEQYPEGVDIVFMRPGELKALGTVRVQKGCMLMLIGPGPAEQLRAAHRQQVEAMRRIIANGNMGHRG